MRIRILDLRMHGEQLVGDYGDRTRLVSVGPRTDDHEQRVMEHARRIQKYLRKHPSQKN